MTDWEHSLTLPISLACSDKGRKQLDSVFTINKAECERAYRQEINGLKALEDERRSCLRQRDDVVTVVCQNRTDKWTGKRQFVPILGCFASSVPLTLVLNAVRYS